MTSTLKLSAVLLLTLSACGTARLGDTTKFGGRVLLEGSYMPAMTDARTLMGEHCGSHFATVERGNVVEFRCEDSGAEISAIAASKPGLKF